MAVPESCREAGVQETKPKTTEKTDHKGEKLPVVSMAQVEVAGAPKDYPGWYQDPTGCHPEQYFESNGVPTQLARRNRLEFMDAARSSKQKRLRFPQHHRHP